ncbi:hypothetical protein FQN54_009155 [Arachnomyces sp. PD_36]|nr:hypothetical protein FQN54_009155 [Arachnomyces sp. PD_36]
MRVFPYVIPVAILATTVVSVQADKPPGVVVETPSLDVIPPCARHCVDNFIEQNYPPVVCQDPTNLNCLCTKNSTSGFTISEGATGCAAASCFDGSPFLPSLLGNLCLHVPESLPNTHDIVSITDVATPLPTQTQGPTTPAVSKTTTPQLSHPETQTSIVGGITPANGYVSASREPYAEGLSKPEIAGISVVGTSAFILAIALLYLCLRRRRRKFTTAKDDLDKEKADVSPELPPVEPAPKRQIVHRDTGVIDQQPISGPINLAPPPPAVTKTPKASPNVDRAEDIGVAIYTDYPEDSPRSQTTRRTDSQLLPDKPNYSLYPEPLRWNNRAPPRRESNATVFEEDSPEGSEKGGQPTVPGCSHGVGLPSDPRALMYAMEKRNKMHPYGSAGAPAQQSNTALSMPSEGNYQNFITMPTLPPGHPHARYSRLLAHGPTCSNKHCSSHAQESHHNSRGQERLSCGHRPHSHTNSVQRDQPDSFGSYSAFDSRENNARDDHEPVNRLSGVVNRLSPVQEASNSSVHTEHSPPQTRQSVTYPKMPRSAAVSQQAETVHEPRAAHLMKATASSSQPQKGPKLNLITSVQTDKQLPQLPQGVDLYLCPQHSSSGSNCRSESSTTSTLLAKRRGETVADQMESGLRVSSISNASPNIGSPKSKGKWATVEDRTTVGDSDNPAAGPSGAASTSRFSDHGSYQEVKLTPTRKGHDMYLSVEQRS